MNAIKKEFIELALRCNVLCFGEFVLKSGRVSPYFFNAGRFSSGEALAKLGCYYAAAITEAQLVYDGLFGPAYKGIPLVASVSCALYNDWECNKPWSFNRKEAKDHGEGGLIVGAPLSGRLLLIDDVMTAGTAIRQSITLIHESNASAAGVVVMLDRQERGLAERSAVQEIAQQHKIPVVALITLTDLIDYLARSVEYHQYLPALKAYKVQYGVDG